LQSLLQQSLGPLHLAPVTPHTEDTPVGATEPESTGHPPRSPLESSGVVEQATMSAATDVSVAAKE
jgi:hypothetical protein